MEVWLRDEKENSMFRFPVIPMPIGKDSSASVDTVGIVQKGKVAVYNGTEPDNIRLESFFPKHEYGFCNYRGFPSPNECVNIIESWKNKGSKLRFIVTDTEINITVIIINFSHYIKNGTGNIYYSLSLMQKDDIIVPEWTPPKKQNVKQNEKIDKSKIEVIPILKRPVKNVTTKEHKVKHGEYLYSIAQKYYGDGSKYKKITNNAENLKRYPSLRKSNMIYSNWKLVIP